MIPEAIPRLAKWQDVCALADRWMLDGELAARLFAMAELAPFGLSIISGYRSPKEQQALLDQGAPAAPPELSTHCACPATGADLWIDGLTPGRYEKALFGEAATKAGLRWGGGSPVDDGGIPLDWNHVDLGPRIP